MSAVKTVSPPPGPAPAFEPPRAAGSMRGRMRRAAEDARTASFLRMVSHELRTPLNAVIGFSEIIARELHGPIGDPRYAEHAQLIRESGLTLLSLVNQILDVARLEAGAMDLDLRPEPLDEIVAEAFAGVGEAAAVRGVRLSCARSNEATHVMCDRRGLGVVLNALLANAVTASPEGGLVEVSWRRTGERMLIEVRDEGPGLEPRELPRLMRPFEQGESALVRRSAGAGLGLPLARLLCQAMHGRLHLETEPGCGVAAVVRLPAA